MRNGFPIKQTIESVSAFSWRNHRLVLLSTFFWAFASGLWFNQRQIYISQLGAAPEQIGSVLAAESVFMALVMIPMGLLSDRWGPKRVILGAWVMGALGLVIMALSQSWQAVVPGLIIYRLTSCSTPAVLSFSLQSSPNRDLPMAAGRSMTAVAVAWEAAQLVAPLIGGSLADRLSLRFDLWVATAILLLAIVTISLSKTERMEPEARNSTPSSLFRNQQFLKLTGYFALTFFALNVGLMLLPNYLQEVRSLSLGSIGMLLSILSLGAVGFNYLGGRIGPRWGFALALVGTWTSLLLLRQLDAMGWIALAFFLSGGHAAAWALMSAEITNAVRPGNQGQAIGVLESVNSIATAIAAWMGGQLYALSPAHDLPFVAGIVSIPAMVAIWFVLQFRWRSNKAYPSRAG